MIKELDTVALTHNLSDKNLRKGDIGTIVFVYKNGEAYQVEFVTTDGSTLAVETLRSNEIRPTFSKKEILHIREIA